MRDERDRVAVRQPGLHLGRARVDLRARRAGAHGALGRDLHREHLGVQLLLLLGRRVVDGHAAEVGDVALEAAARVEREHRLPAPRRQPTRRGCGSRPRRSGSTRSRGRAGSPRRGGGRRSRACWPLGPRPARSRPWHRRRVPEPARSSASSSGRLTARSSSSSAVPSTNAAGASTDCERPGRGLRQEPGLDRDRRGPQAELAHESGGGFDGTRRAHAAVAHVADPRRRVLVAPAIQRAVDEERQVRPAARVAEQREIALDADRVEVREERAVVAEQVADVVTRRRQHEVDACLLHQGVELGAVERRHSRCCTHLLRSLGRCANPCSAYGLARDACRTPRRR